jgi:hypothetical protein
MHHKAGTRRLAEIDTWLARLDELDPLAAWTAEPSVQRLTPATLHATFEGAV